MKKPGKLKQMIREKHKKENQIQNIYIIINFITDW